MKPRFRALTALLIVLAILISLSGCRIGKGELHSFPFDPEIRGGTTASRDLHRTSPEKQQEAASDGRLRFSFDPVTTAVCITTDAGARWSALPEFDNGFSSVVSLTLVSEDGRRYLNSQDHSVAFSAFETTYVSGGVKVTYHLSDKAETARKPLSSLLPGELFVSLTVEYLLTGGKLQVSVDCASVFVSDGFVLESLDLLPYFGASAGLQPPVDVPAMPIPDERDEAPSAEPEASETEAASEENESEETASDSPDEPAREEAPVQTVLAPLPEKTVRPYLLVPDGPGAEIRLDADTPGADAYTFSSDPTASGTYCDEASWFGIGKGDCAVAALVEEGASLALVRAQKRTANTDGVNLVYPTFTLTDTTVSGGEYYYGPLYDGVLRVSYLFLSAPLTSFADMASACREELIRIGRLSQTPALSEAYPLNVSFMCSLNGSRASALTTYEQIEDLVTVLRGKGIRDLNVTLLGGLTGGFYPNAGGRFRPLSSLGGKKGLLRLIDALHAQEVRLYLGLNLFTSPRKTGSLPDPSGRPTQVFIENPVASANGGGKTAFLVSPEKKTDRVIEALRSLRPYAFDGYLLQDAQVLVGADGREQELLSSAVSSLQAYKEVLSSGGALSRLSRASLVTDVPLYTRNEESDAYEGVPFLPAVLHGSVAFSGEPAKAGEVVMLRLLKSVEYGAAPAVQWVFRAGTEYSYENNLTQVSDFCAAAAEKLGDLGDKPIEAHEQIVPGVYKTTFAGGIIVYVNYNNYSVNVGNVSLPPYDYLRLN